MKVELACDYVQGHLRYGHFEATIPEEDIAKFKEMSDDEKKEYVREAGELIIDDYEIDDYECSEPVKIISE
jgi:hypothetical protein